ncbi:hypothetical protein [Kitasatospora sp. NPDC057223]|uniref:hypothetical protein n=1 Tax=Kitasatospora sp. NPDC057223 TaxID=3346055 RepID=UPI00362CAABF
MSNPYQTPPPDPYGGYGQQQPPPQQPYGAPQYPHPQQPGYGYGYPQQQAYVPQAAAQPNSYATASVVLGFIGVLLSCFYGGFIGLIGLGIGIAGLNRSATTGLGRSASIGGIALNTLAVLISVAMVVYLLVNQT